MLIFKVGIEIIKAKGKFSFKWKKKLLFFFVFFLFFFKQRENKEKDVCKHNMKVLDINTEIWEDTTTNRNGWRCLLRKQKTIAARCGIRRSEFHLLVGTQNQWLMLTIYSADDATKAYLLRIYKKRNYFHLVGHCHIFCGLKCIVARSLAWLFNRILVVIFSVLLSWCPPKS